MGIDRSLTDEFPSVVINGTKYHYGREPDFGRYLVENAEYAKDYWSFSRKEDLLAFLINLPESADRDWIIRRHPDWHDVTHEQRGVFLEEHQEYLRDLAAEKQQNGIPDYFNVLCFDETEYYSALADPCRGHWTFFDDVELQVCEQEFPDGPKEFVLELSAKKKFGQPEKGAIKIRREQALKLAAGLIKAVGYIEERQPKLGQAT
jgi:hypothetical protein